MESLRAGDTKDLLQQMNALRNTVGLPCTVGQEHAFVSVAVVVCLERDVDVDSFG